MDYHRRIEEVEHCVKMYSKLVNIFIISGLYSLRPFLACGKSLATSTLQNSSKHAPHSHLEGAMTLASSYNSKIDYISSVEQKINTIINLAAKKSSGGGKSTVVNIPAALRHQSQPLERRKRSPNQTRLCGDFLINMLNVVCLSGRKKREIPEIERNFYYTNRDEIAAIADSQPRSTRLSDVCCRQACDIITLQKACSYFY